MQGLNRRAHTIFMYCVENADQLGVRVRKLANGTTVLDMGYECEGSVSAGIFYASMALGGLGVLSLGDTLIREVPFKTVNVCTGNPTLACMGSQVAGWRFSGETGVVLGSGPGRLLARLPEDDCLRFVEDHVEEAEIAVLCLQGDGPLPSAGLAEDIASRCGVKATDLYLCIAPGGSVVGSVQVAARSIELAMYRLSREGFDVRKVTYARGTAPVAPVTGDRIKAMGRINDSLRYGACVELWVDEAEETLADLAPRLVTCNSRDCFKDFATIFREAGCDFYSVDDGAHTVAEIKAYSLQSGRVIVAGQRLDDLLLRSCAG